MSMHLDKKSVLKKAAQFGGLTFLSKLLGTIRDFLRIRFLGVGAISDAFIIAFKIPHFLRRIFAEGALSSSFVPVIIKKTKEKELENINGVLTLSFLFFEGIVLLLCIFAFMFPEIILKTLAPGFSQDRFDYAVPLLKILFPMILFISSSALFAGALNSVNHFFIPAFGPVLMNIIFIITLLLCLKFNFSVYFLSYGILLSGFAQFLVHLWAILKYNFKFVFHIDKSSKTAFKSILRKFVPSLLGVSIVEINLFIDTIVASFLPEGSVSLLDYGSRIMTMPIGIFAVALATVLLPQFSRFVTYAPKRLNFYVLEVTKIVSFVIIPVTLFFILISDPIFSMIMLKNKASTYEIWQAKWVLIIFSMGLLFFCLNKILVNVFYSLHDTKKPTIALVISTVVNFICNLIGMKFWGIFGIAASTSFSALVLTILFFVFLKKYHNLKFYFGRYFNFLLRYFLQVIVGVTIFAFIYITFYDYIFYSNFGYWLFICSLTAVIFILLFLTRSLFGIKLYFLSK